MIPLSQWEQNWIWNSSTAISKACCGREVFGIALNSRCRQHLERYGVEYRKKSQCTKDQWYNITNPYRRDQALPSMNVDLAIFANLLCRSILLLYPDRPNYIETFVPFLRQPEKCKNRYGVQRSPLILAWIDSSQKYKVAVVAVADQREIDVVYLPREWFKSVWGFENCDPLIQYLKFDNRDRCAVAQGIYFKVIFLFRIFFKANLFFCFQPEYLREIVTAFDEEMTRNEGLHPVVMADYLADIGRDVELHISKVLSIVISLSSRTKKIFFRSPSLRGYGQSGERSFVALYVLRPLNGLGECESGWMLALPGQSKVGL